MNEENRLTLRQQFKTARRLLAKSRSTVPGHRRALVSHGSGIGPMLWRSQHVPSYENRLRPSSAAAKAYEVQIQKDTQEPIESAESDPSWKRLDIQGLRAVAVLLVIVYHAGLPVRGGFVGVDVFFVISGFVITAMLIREHISTGRIAFGRFYLRRFQRLTPALALMVSVTVLISIFVESPFGAQQNTAKTAVGAMLLLANVVIAVSTGGYFDLAAETNPLLNTWSLSVEEQFYLLFPALLALGWYLSKRWGRRQVWTGMIVALVGVVSLGISMASSFGFALPIFGSRLGENFAFYSPATRAWEFAAGAMLALAGARFRTDSQVMAKFVGFLGLGLVAAAALFLTSSVPFPGVAAALPVVGTLLVIWAGSSTTGGVTGWLGTRLMKSVGDLSYSLYLWHWPLIVFAVLIWPSLPGVAIVAAATSVIPAVLSYVFVEQKLRKRILPNRMSVTKMATAVIAPPLALSLFLVFGAHDRWWLTWDVDAASAASQRLASRCVDSEFDVVNCRWTVPDSQGTVLLLGDSQAYTDADGVIQAVSSLHMDTIVGSRSGCPFSAYDSTGSKPLDCSSWQRQTMQYALETKPNVVVIANRSTGYTQPGAGWRTIIGPHGDVAGDPQQAAQLWQEGLNGVVQPLRAAGIGVVIMQNIPEPAVNTANSSLLRRVLPEDADFSSGQTLSDRSGAAAAEAAVAAANKGTVLYDPAKYLCNETHCPLTENSLGLYSGTFHLTSAGSLLLAPSEKAAIELANQQR